MKRYYYFLSVAICASICFVLASCENEEIRNSEKFTKSNHVQNEEIVISYYDTDNNLNVLRSFDILDIITKSTYNSSGSLVSEYDFFFAYNEIPEIIISSIDSVEQKIVLNIAEYNIILNNFENNNSSFSFNSIIGETIIPFTLQAEGINMNAFFENLYGVDKIRYPFNSYAKLPILPWLLKAAVAVLSGASIAVHERCTQIINIKSEECKRRDLCTEIGLCSVKCVKCPEVEDN